MSDEPCLHRYLSVDLRLDTGQLFKCYDCGEVVEGLRIISTNDAVPEPPGLITERTTKAIGSADFLDLVLKKLAMGGDLISLCDEAGVRYADVVQWLNEPQNSKVYLAALDARKEWVVATLSRRLEKIADMDPADILTKKMRVKDLNEIPLHVRKCIESIKVRQLQGDDEGEIIEVKISNRMKGIEMLLKKLGALMDRTEIDVKVSLEDLILGGMTAEPTPARALTAGDQAPPGTN